MFLHLHTKDRHLVIPVRDDFEEGKHPRANNGEFAKGAGSGASGAHSETHKVDVASVLAQPIQIGSAAIKKLQGLVKASTGEEKLALQQHLATTYLKKHISLKKKGSENALKALTQFKKFSPVVQQNAEKHLGLSPSGFTVTAPPVSATKPSSPSAPVDKTVSPEDLEKAKSKYPLPNGMDLASVQAFNEKWTGENSPTTEEGLKAKVLAYKEMKAGIEAEKAEKIKASAEEAAKTMGEAASHYKQLASLSGPHMAEQWVTFAKSKINKNGVKGISAGEAAHIVAYSSNAYAQTNAALRAGVMDEARWAHVKELNNSLSKLPPHVGVTRRGAKLSAKQIELYKPGMIVEERGFMSTSKGQGWGGTKFEIRGTTGRDISKLSAHPGEEEVLFRSGTRFKVISNNGHSIVLKEVD